MKRDLDLVRAILLKVEAESSDSRQPIDPFKIEGWADAVITHHIWLLIEADFIRAHDRRLIQRPGYAPICLTWTGHDFLDAIRDPEVWRQAKAGAAKIGGASADLLWELAKAYGKHLVKERLGFDLN